MAKAMTVKELIEELLALREDGFGDCEIAVYPDNVMTWDGDTYVMDFDSTDHLITSVETADPEGDEENDIKQGFVLMSFATKKELEEKDELEPLAEPVEPGSFEAKAQTYPGSIKLV